MKDFTTDDDNPALTENPVEEITPQPDLIAPERRAHKIILTTGGKRYEFTHHVQVREITKGPAKLIEMPGRSVIDEP
jgi:hypothetical protein